MDEVKPRLLARESASKSKLDEFALFGASLEED